MLTHGCGYQKGRVNIEVKSKITKVRVWVSYETKQTDYYNIIQQYISYKLSLSNNFIILNAQSPYNSRKMLFSIKSSLIYLEPTVICNLLSSVT